MENTFNKSYVERLVKHGEKIGVEEYHPSEDGFFPDYIDGPKQDIWMNEINIMNERYLKKHPVYNCIKKTFQTYKKDYSSHELMMGYLKALVADDEFWEEISKQESKTTMQNRKSIEQLLREDIEQCESFLNNPNNIEEGKKLYTEITSRYDSLIKGFGDGLYQYYSETKFYDPDLSKDSLLHNLKVLHGRMITYEATNYSVSTNTSLNNFDASNRKVFIVHGHDNEAKQELARTLEKGGFEAIILHEQPDSGKTIIEKIERFSDVNYAVVLYTECDKGRDKNTPVEQEQNRARQNVVFEHGYLIGKLGRDRVTALVKGEVETPGDISGVVYTKMDSAGAWKMQLGKNMKDVGISVDMNKFI